MAQPQYLNLATGLPFEEVPAVPLPFPYSTWDGVSYTRTMPGGASVILDANARVIFPATTGIVANPGGGRAGATALPGEFNQVTTSVAAVAPFDSVVLPASNAGLDIVVANQTNNPIQVFAAGADTINGVAGATGITQPPNSVEVYYCVAPGLWQVDPGIGYSGQLFTELAQDNVTANAGGGQAGATALWAQTTRVTTVATVGDSVKLPPSAPGLELLVINHGAQSMQVYGTGADTIDDAAAATGVSQMVNSMVIYTCAATGRWYSNGIGTGFAGQFPTVSFADALTAHAGGGQGAGTAITTVMSRFTVVASANDSATLPASKPGMQLTVINAAGANSMNVFPAAGEQINALGANAAFALAAGKTVTFYCTVAGQWHSLLSA